MLKCKQMISCALATMIAMQGSGLVFAGEARSNMQLNNSFVSNKNHELHIDAKLTQEQRSFMQKLQKMFGEFEIKEGKLSTKIPIDKLAQKYDLNAFDIDMLNKMDRVGEMAQKQKAANVWLEDWKICFDNQDLKDYLAAAAGMGATALIAEFESLSAMLGGPIGMLITSVIAALGGANPVDMCWEIGVAVASVGHFLRTVHTCYPFLFSAPAFALV